MRREDITPDIARSLISHNRETGELFWKERPRSMFKTDAAYKSWMTRHNGKPCINYLDWHGYYTGKILGVSFSAHRVLWALEYGYWPEEVDHINHNGADNRLCNLREVSHRENGINLSRKKNNTTGVTGVYWDRANHKWRASIQIEYTTFNIGRYGSLLDAVAARYRAEREHGFHDNHGRDIQSENASR